MSITNKAAIENYMLITIDSDFNDQVEEWIAGVEEEMNMMTDRQLIADEDAAAYKYDGTGKKTIMVDDFVTVESVEIKESVTSDLNDITDDCFLYPANKTPKWKIESDNWTFPKGRQNIIVTGRRGYFDADDVPANLKFAATVLVAGIINFSNTHEGEVKRESIGRYTVEYVTDKQKGDYDSVIKTLNHYRRIR